MCGEKAESGLSVVMPERSIFFVLVFLGYWLVTGAACDTFLEAEGTISINDSLSEQYDGKRLLGVWALEAKKQSENSQIPDANLCESLGVVCSLTIQSIDVSYALQGESDSPVVNPARDRIVTGQTDYPFKLNNIHGPGEKGKFAKNYVGAFIDIDDDGKWGTTEPFGWAIENPLSRRCVDRRSSEHRDCIGLIVPVE